MTTPLAPLAPPPVLDPDDDETYDGDHGDLIDRYLADLADRTPSADTLRTYGRVLRRVHAALQPVGLPRARPGELRAWLASGQWSPSTRRTYRTALRSFFSWATAEGWIDYDPSAALPSVRRRRRLPRPTTDDETRIIVTTAAEPVRTWSVLAAYAGLRRGEIATLDRDDVAEDWTRILGKGDKERVVPTHPLVWAACRHLPPGPIAGGLHRDTVGRMAVEEYVRLRLVGVTLHRLRHWAGTQWLIATGGDLRAVQELLGHESPETTAVYTLVRPAAMRAAVAGVPVW